MKTVVKLDYATFAFEQGAISIPKIEDALAQCDLHFSQVSNAGENSPYISMVKYYHSMNELSRGNFNFVGVLHARPRSRKHGSNYISEAPASLFWKDEGFALAGDEGRGGDAIA